MKYLAFTAVLFLCAFLEFTDSQEDTLNVDDIRDKISSNLDIPGLNNLDSSATATLEEAENLFKQKCEKNGGPHAYENVKHAPQKAMTCLESLVDVEKLKAEMEQSKPTGDLDIVFKKYCRKKPILQQCVQNFTTAIEPCLEEQEKENKRVIQNIMDSLLNFVCHKEGDRIALFISAGGPECIQSKQEELQNCINNTFGSYLPKANPQTSAVPGLNSIPSLAFTDKECNDIMRLQDCAVKELEKCDDPTPANIVDSILKYILKVTPCANMYQAQGLESGQSSVADAVSLLSTTSMVFLLLRFI